MTLFKEWSSRLSLLLVTAAVCFGLLLAERVSYLFFHSLVEVFSVIVGASIFILVWNARHLIQNSAVHMLGVSFLVVSMLDLTHTLAFRGMGVLPGTGLNDPHPANLATQLWLAARYSQSLALLVVLWLARSHARTAAVDSRETLRLRPEILLVAGGAWMTLLLLAIFNWRIFPDAYLTELTPFKIVSEYVIIAILALAAIALYRYRSGFQFSVWQALMASVILLIFSEAAFTAYLSVEDWANFTGHVLKVLAYALIYHAIIQTTFVKPQETLFQERLAYESALRESEQRARARAAELSVIMDTVPAIMWITNDPKSEVVTGNAAAAALLRMAPDENLSKTAPDASHTSHFRVLQNGVEIAPEDLPLQKSAATGQPVRDFEETIAFSDGTSLHLLGNVSPLHDPQGHPAGAVAAFIDITERVKAEQALQESEQRYRSLFETISESFAVTELVYDEHNQAVDIRFLQVNPAFEQMAGVDRSALIGSTYRQIAQDNLTLLPAVQRVAETGEAQRIVRFDTILNKHLDILLFRTSGSRVAWLVVDITEQQRSRQALQASEDQLRRLVDSNIVGVIFFDEQGNITLANDAFLELTGYTREDLANGAVTWQSLTPEEYITVDAENAQLSAERGGMTPYEKEYICKDGSRVPVLLGFAVLPQGTTRYICFVVDLTEQKRAEEAAHRYALRLEESNRALESFAFVASHDMQEPLRKIQAFGERLKVALGSSGDETALDYLERMLSASRRMRGMVDDLLALSRVTTRAQPFAQVDLNQIVAEVLSDLELRVEASRAHVTAGDLPTIEADPTQMHQLFLNLVNNALKFHTPGQPPVVEISGALINDGTLLALSVRDEGIGFDPQFSERIFQPFQRLHGRSEYEGSGIGLSICKKIVERHGGTIEVKSTPGAGSIFTALLPVLQTPKKVEVHAKTP